MAQSWRNQRGRAPRPLDAAALERIALCYVERYATTRAKLAAYLDRKIRERGWAGDTAPDVAAIVDRFASLGYVDDVAFAEARAASLARRGYGVRRVSASLRAAGIGEAHAAFVTQENQSRARAVALAYARRRRIGPFATAPMDRPAREKALAAMIRAGHDFEVAREIISLAAADVPEWAKVNGL